MTLLSPPHAACAGNIDALPRVAHGSIERLSSFHSAFVDERNIDIWLPPGYSTQKRYPVLYMQDGQMLYDAATTWNKQSWKIDQVISRLVATGNMPDIIVVGIWNNSTLRRSEYFPEKAIALLPEPTRSQLVNTALHGHVLADRYLRFLTEELKPAIDQRYSTFTDRDHTYLMGSSMGGLISLYAMSEYPNIFGAAACLSTHWIGVENAKLNAIVPIALFNYLQTHLPDPQHHRIYMDRGTETLDALYAVAQPVVDQLIRDNGYDDTNFMTRVFVGDKHVESDWSARVEIPLQFLFTGKRVN